MRRIFGGLLICLLGAVALAGCAKLEGYEGDGGVFDNPIGIAVRWPYAYVTNGNYDLSDEKQGKLNVVDLRIALTRRDKSVIYQLDTQPYLARIVLSPDGLTAYATTRRTNEVLYFDLTDPARPEPIDLDPDKSGTQGVEVSRQPFGLALAPDGGSLWVACMSQGNVTIVDLATNRIAQTIQIASGVSELAFDPAGRYAYVTNRLDQTVTMLDAQTGEFVASFEPGRTNSLTGYDNRGLAFTPDGRYLFIAARSPGDLLMLDTDKLPFYPQYALLRTLPTDSGPTAVDITPDGREAWVVNYDSNTIFAFDAQTGALLRGMYVGEGPYDIEIFEDGDNPGQYYALTTNFNAHNVSLVDVQTRELVWVLP